MKHPQILNLTLAPIEQIKNYKDVVELPEDKKKIIENLCSSECPVPPQEIRQRARQIAMAIEDQDVSRVLLEGPHWLLTELLAELEGIGKVPIFAVKDEQGWLRVLSGK
jgi:hypothetical protein